MGVGSGTVAGGAGVAVRTVVGGAVAKIGTGVLVAAGACVFAGLRVAVAAGLAATLGFSSGSSSPPMKLRNTQNISRAATKLTVMPPTICHGKGEVE